MFGVKVEKGEFLSYTLANNSWIVKDKKGTIYKFGNTAQSRQDNPADPSKVYKWMLEEVRDTNDNFIRYEYFKDQGQIYPNKIYYTGSGVADGVFEVEFMREGRLDSALSYKTGFLVKAAYRISEIQAKVDGILIGKYTLSYQLGSNGKRSLLAYIVTIGKDEDTGAIISLPATAFTYRTTAVTTWQRNESFDHPVRTDWYGMQSMLTYTDSSFYKVGVRHADVNGDSLPDILESDERNVTLTNVFLNKGDGTGWALSPTFNFPSRPGWGGYPEPVKFMIPASFDTHVQAVDLNGDGFADLLEAYYYRGVYRGAVYLNRGNNTGWDYHSEYQIPNRANFTPPTPLSFIDETYRETPVRLADVNGDGLPDLIEAGYWYGSGSPVTNVYLNKGDGTGWAYNSAFQLPRRLNQNGQTVPVIFQDSTLRRRPVRIADVNGDGLADLIEAGGIYDEAGRIVTNVYLNKGDGTGWAYNSAFQLPTRVGGDGLIGPVLFIDDYQWQRPVELSDIDGDGLLDLVESGYGGVSTPQPVHKVYLNKGDGTGWSTSVSWTYPKRLDASNQLTPIQFIDWTHRDHAIALEDMNGDRLPDLTESLYEYPNNSQPFEGVYLNQAMTFIDGLAQITYGNGGSTSVTYQSSAQVTVGGARANPELPFIVTTVSQLAHNDGLGTIQITTYTHEGGEYYYGGPFDRKFAGFGKITKTDSVGNKTITYYHQGNGTNSALGEFDDHSSKIGYPYLVEQQDASGNLYNAVVTQWDRYDLGNGRSFVKKIRQTNLTYDGNTTHRDTAGTFSYDNTNGNLLVREQWGEVIAGTDGSFTDTGSDKLSSTYTYAVGSPAVTGLLAAELTLDQVGNKVNEIRHYYDLLPFGSVNKGNETKTERWMSDLSYVDIEKTYNSFGLVTQELDARDKATTYTYDTYNLYPATVTNALGQQTQYLYDYSAGKLKQVTDPNGAISQTIYDGLDRVVEQKQSDRLVPSTLVTGATYTYTYLSVGLQTQETKYLDTSTSVDAYSYTDGLGRPVQTRVEAETPGQFTVSDIIYNNRGLKAKESLPYFSTGFARTAATTDANLYSTYTYDAIGRVVSTIKVVGTVVASYDDWKTTVTDARGKPKHTYADAYGRLVKVEEVNGGSVYSTNYEYNGLGLLIKLTDAAGNIRNFTYDALGRRLTAQDLHAPADSTFGTWTYTYDYAGNLLTKIDAKNQNIAYTYDDLNRVLTEDFTGQTGIEVNYAYDTCINGLGRLCSVTNSALIENRQYDALGSLTREIKTIAGIDYQTDYFYDRQGNQTLIINPDGSQVKNIYNTAGQLERVQRKETTDSDFIDVVTNFDYGPHGQVIWQQNANGSSATNTYDSAELYRLRSKVMNSGAVNLQNLTYTYDANGNITRLVDASATNSAKTVDYTYDDLNRLLTATATGAANGQNYMHSYTYDAIGNILTGPAGVYAYTGNQGSSFANPHAVTNISGLAYNYDNNGNLISRGDTTYTWDYSNRLVQATVPGQSSAPVTVSYYPASGDGSIYRNGSSWSTVRSATSGSSVNYTGTTLNVNTGKSSSTNYRIQRAFLPFNTAALPDDSVITSAKLKVYVASKLNNDNDGDDWITVVQGLQPSTTSLTTADYDLAGTINNSVEGIDIAERKDITSVPTGAYITFNLNATGQGWVSKTGATKLALREGHDVINSAFVGSSGQYNQLQIRTGEYSGTAYDPMLEVTYTVPPPVNTITYAYDSTGQRVKMESGGLTTVYPTSFYNTDGTTAQKHIMAGGVIATVTGTGVSAVPHYVTTDHLTGSNVVTTSTGILEELMDYYPFGAIRLDEKAGAFSEQRKFTGHEYDSDTTLTYMNARYYDGVMGRFISQDPLAIEALQTADNKKFQYLLANPQNWNTYAYTLNNPLVAVDPSGLLTIYVPGTNYNTNDLNNSHLYNSLTTTFNDNNVRYLEWNGGPNDSGQRTLAAQTLANAINSWNFADGEKLNIVAHSHGGNIVMEATHMLNRSIDQLVTLGTPVTSNYQSKDGMIAQHINVYSNKDIVQVLGNKTTTLENLGKNVGLLMPILTMQQGGFIGSILAGILGGSEVGLADREFAGGRNVNIDNEIKFNYGPLSSHNALWSDSRVWNAIANKYLKK